LPDVYEWLIPDAKLTPEGSVAALGVWFPRNRGGFLMPLLG
jgi:hypothetical protein